MAGKSRTVDGMMQADTKRTRKYTTMWGTIYIPLTVVSELGDPERVRFTLEAVEADGGEG